MRALLIYLLVFVSLVVLVCAQTTPNATETNPPVPAPTTIIPFDYSVVVSANSDEFGFTYAYREYYNDTLKLWRADVNNTKQIYALDKNLYTIINTTSLCTTYNVSANANRARQPSATMLRNDFVDATYVGIDKVRNIGSYYFTKNETVVRNNSTWTATTQFYFDEKTKLPVRLVRKYYNDSTVTPAFSMYIDWVNWNTDLQVNTTYTVPTTCSNSADASGLDIFNNRSMTSTVDHTPLAADAPFPKLAPSFYSVVEGVFDVPSNPQFTTVDAQWFYDSSLDTERVDLSLDQSVLSYIYDYNRTLEYNTAYDDKGCGQGRFDGFSILANSGVGTLHQLLVPSDSTPLIGFNPSLAKYAGQSTVRGVRADTWVISKVKVTIDNEAYEFDTSIYFFPKGWQFLGRNVHTGSVPMRVLNNGTVTTTAKDGTTTTSSYVGEWDIFQYIDYVPDVSVLNSTSIGCDGRVPDAPSVAKIIIPDQYSVFISYNDKKNGITAAYEEISDTKKNLTRVFIYGGDQYIIDLNDLSVSSFNPYNSSKSCQIFPFYVDAGHPENGTNAFYPTYLTYKYLTLDNFTYVGNSSDVARGLMSDYYERAKNENLNFTIGIYVDAYSHYPLRLVFDTLVIDYIDWYVGAPNATVFIKPNNGCLAEVPTYFYNTTTNYDPSKPLNETAPVASSEFFMVLEGKTITLDTSRDPMGLEWFYSKSQKKERIDFFINDAMLSSTYEALIDYDSSLVYMVDTMTNECTNSSIFEDDGSFVSPFGSGYLHDVFDPSYKYSTTTRKPTTVVYNVTTLRSGLPVQKWTYMNITSRNEGVNYTFDASVYFYPEGWSFPGRGITNERVPLRVEIVGTYADDDSVDVKFDFQEIWDIFEYHPYTPYAENLVPCATNPIPVAVRIADPTKGPTPTPTPTPIPTPAPTRAPGGGGNFNHKLSGGVKAAIAIVIIVAVLGLVIGVLLIVRKRKIEAQQPRENRTFEHMPEEEDF